MLLLGAAPLPAAAQILDPQARTAARPQRVHAKPALETEEKLSQDQEDAFSDGRWGTEVRLSSPFLNAEPTAPESAPADGEPAQTLNDDGDVEQEGPADVLGAEQAQLARRPPPQDGDPVGTEEPLSVPDGVIDLQEPYALTEATDATLPDLRSPADLIAFSGPDAGFDPLLLEALETNPVFRSQPFGPFGIDPFAPLGRRIGSFTLYSGVEADGDYNSNIFASPEAVGDTALEVRPAARLVSNWSTNALELRASGDLSFHDRFSSEDDRAYLVEALGRLDITRRTDLQGLLAHEEAQESRSAINASSAGTRPDIVVNRARGAFNHTFNRLSLQLRGAIIDTNYGTNIFDDVVQSNADRDFTLYEEAMRPQWEFSPTFLVFTDIAFNQRDYSIAAFTDGINRTSTGQRYRAGVSFGNTGSIVRGEVSLGYGAQTPDSPLLPVIDGLLIDGNLLWSIDALTTLLLTAATDVAETTTSGSGGVLERQYAAELRHNFGTRLVGSIGLGYFTRDFVGGDLFEDQFTGATGLEYYLNRNIVLFGRYQHTAFNTTSFDGNYTVEEVQLGVRLRDSP